MHIKFKNWQLNYLIKFLDSLDLNIKDSRMRTRFIRMIAKYGSEVLDPEKIEILEEFCTKNEEGKPLFADEKNRVYLFEDPDKEDEATKAIQDLYNEDYPIPLDEYNKMMILSVANAIINNDEILENIKVSGQMADAVDWFYDQFEIALEFYTEEKEEKPKKKKKKD